MEKQSITALMSCFGRTLDALAALCAPGSLLAFDYPDDESDIIGLSQKAFKHLDASMMI